MLDKDTGARFDQDPNLDRPLRPETRDFMQRLRGSEEFDYFLLNQLSGDKKADGGYIDRGELGVWGERFVDRIFDISSPADADRLLLPWQRWSEVYSQLNEKYSSAGGGHDNYETMQSKFAEAGIPDDLKEQIGDMPEDKFRFNAESYLFRFTRAMKESIDMMEGLPRPVSAETVFKVQRITRQPLYPEGGIQKDEVEKPDVRRIKQDGKQYIAFYFEGQKPDIVYEDRDGDPDWARWTQLEIGSHIVTVPTRDHEIDNGDWGWKPGESGTVYGYEIMGAGDRMLFQPSVGHIALLVKDDKTAFLKSALVKQSRLDSEVSP